MTRLTAQLLRDNGLASVRDPAMPRSLVPSMQRAHVHGEFTCRSFNSCISVLRATYVARALGTAALPSTWRVKIEYERNETSFRSVS